MAVDTTIRIALDVDGSQAVKEFSNVAEASKGVLDNVKSIKDSVANIGGDKGDFFTTSEQSIRDSFSRINAIDKKMSDSPFFSEHDLSNLYKEKEFLRRSIEATIQDVRSFTNAYSGLVRSLGTMDNGGKSVATITSKMPQLLSFVSSVVEFQRKANTLMDTPMMKAGIKNKIEEAGLFEELGFSKTSKQADYLSEVLMLRGASQLQRSNFVNQLTRGSERKAHIYESFSQMLPSAFRSFHDVNGKYNIPAGKEQRLTNAEKNIIENLLLTNPYFAKAAESAGAAVRSNGQMGMRNNMNRNMVNDIAANLYDVIINSAKGMGMYGITDVNDPNNWEKIARKTNKPLLGSMSAARVLSDNFSWLAPGRQKGSKQAPLSEFSDIGAIGFSPMINRYEVAKYTLEDLKNNVNLNGKRKYEDDPKHEKYFAIDHSLHLEKIFRARKNGKMPTNNDSIDDLFYVALDDRLKDPNLDKDLREQLENEYAQYIKTGITKNVFGRDVHYSFSRAHKGLGLEFVADPLFNKITNNGKDLSFFRGGLKQTTFTGEKAYENMAKAVEYASKNATSGESIESLFGTRLPENLKIAIFDLEEIAKNGNMAPGMNGQSYINRKYVPTTGFQARMPGIKTALNSLDMAGVLSYFGGNAKTISPTGEIETIDKDTDLLISWSDIKNGDIKYKDDNGKFLPLAEIKKNIIKQINETPGKIFASRTMNDANGGVHWLSRQFAQVLKGDAAFSAMTTKALLDEYERAGTPEGAMSSVFAGESEMRDLILETNGAILKDRKIQDRIAEYRAQLLSRISKGDVVLPKELDAQRAMASPWIFNALISGMKNINASGTGLKDKNDTTTYYDTMLNSLSKEQRETLGLITMDDNEVAFEKIMADVLGIGRYPATSRSARKVSNAVSGNSKRAKAIRKAMQDAGLDTNAFYIAPSSPIMDMLQDADFDGDVMELIGLAYSGKKKNGKNATAAEILNRAYTLGMERIDKAGYSEEERKRRQEALTKTVYSGKLFSYDNGKDIMKTISAMMQDGAFMGAPDAVQKNAANIPWSEEVLKAMADSESQYSVNSVRGKKGKEMESSKEEIAIMTKYRPFNEFFNLVDKSRDTFGNINESDLIRLAAGSDGLQGARFWNTNLPFHTMSGANRSMMLSRYMLKQKGVDINKNYNWDYIFDTVLGKKNESTALGRMQSALRDVWTGYLNADYLAVDDETIAKLGDLRSQAIDEQQALVKKERDRLGAAYDKKGSNYSIAQNVVDRLGGRVISNAVAGMALTTSKMHEGDNDKIFTTLEALGMPNITGGFDFSRLMEQRTNPDAFNKLSSGTKNTDLARLATQINLLSTDERKRMIDNIPRLSFSTMEKLAYDPASFLKMVVTGQEQELSSPAIEIGQAAHAAIEHFMSKRMTGGKDNPLDERQIEQAQKEAVEVFDEYLGLAPLKNLKQIETRGLNDAERIELNTQGTNLNQRYAKLRKFLSSKSLLDIYPEDEWEVVGIESSDVGPQGDKTPGGRMKIHGKGEQLTSPKEVEFSGAYDLRFRNRNTGKEVMADIKNYWNPSTTTDWEKWRVQQQLYAKQLIDNGVPIEEIGIIMPYQNQLKQMSFSNMDLNQNDENIKRSVSALQQAFSGDNFTVKSILDLSKFVRETMFGSAGRSFQDQYSEHSKQRGINKINPNMITDALFMHDKYNEAINTEQDILKFVNQKTRPRETKFNDAQIWRSKINSAEDIYAQAKLEEQVGNKAQAADLEARYYSVVGSLNSGLAQAAALDERYFGEDIQRSIRGQSGTKKTQELIKDYESVIDRQKNNQQERELLKQQIEAVQSETDESKQTLDSYDKMLEDQKKESSFLEKVSDYSQKIKEAENKGLSHKARGLKAARTKFIKSHKEFADQSEFEAVSEALKQNSVVGEQTAGQLLHDRREELNKTITKTEQERNKTAEEFRAKNADLLSLTAGLNESENIANENKPIIDRYIAQIRESAKELLESTFGSLSDMVNGETNKPFDTKSARRDFVTAVGNAKTDAIDLFEKGIISSEELQSRLIDADNLLSEESLNKFDAQQIEKEKERLGLTKKTPEDIANKWYNERQSVLTYEKKRAEDLARKAYLEAEYDPQSTLEERNRLEREWEQARAAINEETEQEKQLKQQRDRMITYDSEYQDLKLRQQAEINSERNKNILHQQELSQAQFQRQQRRRYSRSRIAGALYSLDDRQLSLKEQVRGYSQNNASLQRRQEQIDKELEKPGLTEERREELESEKANNAKTIDTNTEAIQRANREIEQLGSFTTRAGAAFQGLSQSIGMVAHRLGRQLFMKALNETKQFVKQFDASMNEIQAITLKSDKEMASVRSQTINKALGLRTSVSNVATTEAALYRQGLSDAEVSSRTESIIKFATVTKLNVAEATKIITTALQNDLVPSAEAAMDALVALGDSAATTAAEIGKGMQKAAASAKVAGVSYAELTALLTIGTSDTQLSGTQVGTALQTVFTRMRRMSLSGWTADQNGEKTTASDAEAALKAVGVDLYDDKSIGKMRSAYDVMRDLSKVWQNLSDVQKSIVTNAMAGTRQTNIFSTLMEGMSEDNGETLDKYLGLAEGSEGVTQTKYEIAMQSLSAAMDELKSSWDAVVESFTNSGAITGALDLFSGFLQGVANLTSNGGQIGVVLSAVAAGIVAIGVAVSGVATGPVGLLLQLLTAIGTFGAGYLLTSLAHGNKNLTTEEINQRALNDISNVNKINTSEIERKKGIIDEVEKAGKAWNKLNNAENTDNLTIALGKLEAAFPGVSAEVQNAITNLNDWTKAVDKAKKTADELSEDSINSLVENTKQYVATNLPSDYNSYINKKFISVERKNDIIESFRNAVNDHAYGTISGEAIKLNSIKAMDSEKKARSFAAAYQYSNEFKAFADTYLSDGLKTILSDSTYESIQGEATQEELARNLDYILSQLENHVDSTTLKSAMSSALNYRYDQGYGLNSIRKYMENGEINLNKLATEQNDDKSKAYVFASAALGSGDIQNWIQQNDENGTAWLNKLFANGEESFNEVIEQEDAIEYFARQAEKFAVEMNTNDKRQATRLFLRERLGEVMSETFSAMANLDDRFDTDKVQKLFINELNKEMESTDFYNKDGSPNEEVLNNFIYKFLDDWLANPTGFLSEKADKVFTAKDFNYHLDETNPETWFDSYDQIKEYIDKHPNEYNYSDIKTSNNEEGYQNAQKAIDAMLLKNNENKTAANYAKAIDIITSDNINSLEDLLNAYDKKDLGQELSNVLSSNAELLGAYVATSKGIMSFDEFQNVAKQTGQGRTNRADIVSNLLDYINVGALSVEEFRTSENYSGLYNTFKSIVGDSADAVLNAIEDGIYDANSDLAKTFNKSVVAQKLKENFEFGSYYKDASEYILTSLYGTDLEKQTYAASQTSEQRKFNDYNAAIERYISGRATPEDYSIIAAMGDFSEIALKNGIGNESFLNRVAETRNVRQADLGAAQTEKLKELLSLAGLTYDEYINGLDEVITVAASDSEATANYWKNESRIFESQESYTAKYKASHSKTGTRRELANKEYLDQIEDLLSNPNFAVDENGNLTYIPGKEEKLTSAAVLEASKVDLTQRTRLGLIKEALDTGKEATALITDTAYAEALTNDETLRRMVTARAAKADISAYIGRQLTGQKGTFADNYGWIANRLFGFNWKDLSTWNQESIRSTYQLYQGTETGNFIEEMLSQMPNAENLKKYVSGETESLPENFATAFVEWMAQETLSGLENAEEIARNQAVLKTGNAAEKLALTSSFEQQRAEAQNAQYYLNNRTAESAGILASYLDISETKARSASDEELQNALDTKVKDLLIKEAESYGAQLDSSFNVDTASLSEVSAKLTEAAQNLDEEAKKKVLDLADQLDEAGRILGERTSLTLSEAYVTAREGLNKNSYEYQGLQFIRDNGAELYKRAQEGTSFIDALSASKSWDTNWNSVFDNSGVVAAMSLYNNGAINQATFNDFLTGQMVGAGKDSSYINILASAVFGNGYHNGQFTDVTAFQQGFNNAHAEGNGDILEWYKELESLVGTDLFSEIAEGGDKAEDALKKLNEELNKKRADEATKYGKAISNTATAISKLKKGGKEAAEGTAMLRNNFENLQDQMTAIGNANGKSGKQLDSKTLEFIDQLFPDLSSQDIKNMSKERLDEILADAPDYINEVFTDSLQSMLDDAIQQAQNIATEKGITIDFSSIKVDTNGQPDFSSLDSEIQAILETIWSLLDQLAGDLGSVEIDTQALADNMLKVVGKVNKKKGGGYNGGKGGGGGGGKSETDKLLEKQKQRTAQLEHQSKMLEIREKYLDFVNDYGGHSDNIDQQIAAQESLRSAYAQNLSELKAQLAAVEEGSDDYNKLADSIRSTEEAMASITNTINDLNAKKIQIVATSQENADKPANQRVALLQKYAQRYQTSGQFEAYTKAMEATISETRKQIQVNNSQISEWEGLLGEYYEGSDSWIEVRDKIWAIQLENAELENQIASDTIALEEAKVAQIADDLAADKMNLEHVNNMIDTYGSIYQSTRQFEHYRDTLETSNENLSSMKDLTDKAIEEVKKQVESMASTDPARRTALQTLYELEEASAQYEATMLQNRQAIEESLISELQDKHTDAGSILEHELKLLSEQEKEFSRNNDFVNYENILAEKSRNAADRIAEQQEALEDYIELQNSGNITEGSEQWKSLEEIIRSTKESIAALKNEQQELNDELEKTQFETLKRFYQEGIEGGFEGMDQLTHEQSLIQYEQTKYQNRDELTNYGTALGWENENLQKQRKAIEEQINATKALQETHRDNPQLFASETEYLRKLEEEYSKNTNAIEKNSEAQKKNKIAIIQTQAAVKKTADNAIRETINKQKQMLSSTVSVQNSILDVIRKNAQEQWDLERKTLEKKKQSLNEEKNLITEQLNFKKRMMDQESKDEELAELKRQLALISADSTRTKEANELRRKINEMEKEQAIQTAEDIANAEIKSIDDRIKANENYAAVREEDLNNQLENANNFREELDKLLNGSFEDFVEWNAEYNNSYIKATAEQRKQMEQGWEDTWESMLGELKTYWDEADVLSQTKEGWLAFVTSVDSFQSLSAEEQARRYSELSDQYDAMVKAQIDNATYDDQHEILNTLQDLKDWTFNVNIVGLENYLIDSEYSNYSWRRNTADGDLPTVNEYNGIGKVYVPETTYYAPAEEVSSGGSGSGGGTLIPTVYYTTGSDYIGSVKGWKNVPRNTMYASENKAQVESYIKDLGKRSEPSAFSKTEARSAATTIVRNILGKGNVPMTYDTGGYVDYTGLAWVDGTKSRPESFLDSTDTKLLRGMLDAFNYVSVKNHAPHIGDLEYGKPAVSVGDVYVTLNEAKLENDADYDEIAKKVGNAFTKQLQKDGFNLAGYNW